MSSHDLDLMLTKRVGRKIPSLYGGIGMLARTLWEHFIQILCLECVFWN